MDNSPILSVIVPVYKVAKFLPKLLTEISNQTLKDIEVILVCDGDDADLWICKRFVELDKRFQLIENIKKGPGGARNAGLEVARGRYIFFCDADDSIGVDFCEKMVAPFYENANIAFTASGTCIVFEGEEDVERKMSDEKYFEVPPEGVHRVKEDLFGGINTGLWNKVYRKDIIDQYQIRFPEKLFNEDAYFNWCYWSVSNAFYSMPDLKYFYTRRANSLMWQTFNKSLGKAGSRSLDHLKVAELFYQFLERNDLLGKFQSAFWNCYLISYWFAKDHTSQAWQHKVKQLIVRFLSSHRLPTDKKYAELASFVNEANSKQFNSVYAVQKSEFAITAVLPVFKCEQYLERCIDSVLSQTLQNIEVILAVDGGEACYQLCDKYAENDSRVKVIRDQGSYGKSVNAGIRSAKGEYIAIVECDDWCEPDMFDTLYKEAKQYDADVVKGGWYDSYDDERLNKTRVFNYPDGFLNVYDHQDFFSSQPSVWSAIYRKEYLISNNIFFSEARQSFVDGPFHYKTLYCTEDYVLVNQPLYHYYQDNPNQSVQSGGKVHDGINAEKFAYDDIHSYPGLWEKIGTGIVSAMLEHLCWNDSRIKDPQQHKEFERAASMFVSSIDLSRVELNTLNARATELLRKIAPNIIAQIKTNTNRTIFRLLGFVPLFSIEKCGEVTKFKLFTVINLISIKKNVSTIRCTFLKLIPLFVIRKK